MKSVVGHEWCTHTAQTSEAFHFYSNSIIVGLWHLMGTVWQCAVWLQIDLSLFYPCKEICLCCGFYSTENTPWLSQRHWITVWCRAGWYICKALQLKTSFPSFSSISKHFGGTFVSSQGIPWRILSSDFVTGKLSSCFKCQFHKSWIHVPRINVCGINCVHLSIMNLENVLFHHTVSLTITVLIRRSSPPQC